MPKRKNISNTKKQEDKIDASKPKVNANMVLTVVMVVVISFAFVVGVANVFAVQANEGRIREREMALAEYQYWKNIAQQNPGYLDAWLKLTIVSWQLGENENAYYYLSNAKLIDPESRKLKEVEESLY